ncbi:MAG: hypothetical protein ACK559_36510, partial [bacterium]
LKFFTRVEGGIGGPNTPGGALGSPVKTSPNLLAGKNQTLILVPVLRLLLNEWYGPTYVLTVFRSGAERLNNFKEEKYDDSNLLTLLFKTPVVLCENR